MLFIEFFQQPALTIWHKNLARKFAAGIEVAAQSLQESGIRDNLKMQKACSIDSPKGHKDNKSYKGLVNTDAIAGCASIMKASKLSSSGLSDPEFFYGEEDTELSFRLTDSPESLKIDLNQVL